MHIHHSPIDPAITTWSVAVSIHGENQPFCVSPSLVNLLCEFCCVVWFFCGISWPLNVETLFFGHKALSLPHWLYYIVHIQLRRVRLPVFPSLLGWVWWHQQVILAFVFKKVWSPIESRGVVKEVQDAARESGSHSLSCVKERVKLLSLPTLGVLWCLEEGTPGQIHFLGVTKEHA